MPRTSENHDTQTRKARSKLAPRAECNPYYCQVVPGITLGYIRRAGRPGSWVVRERIGSKYVKRVLGLADDNAEPDGRDVLTFTQAHRMCTNADATKAPGRMTVADALAIYFDTMQSKHAPGYRGIANKHIVPALGSIRIDRLTKTQIETWQAALVVGNTEEARRRSKDTANRTLVSLKAALNKAFRDDSNGITTDSAWRRVQPFKKVARSRTTILAPEQVASLIEHAETVEPALAQFLEAAYLTGARSGELSLCDVSHFDARRYTLNIPGGKTGGRPVTLTSEAVAFFRRVTMGRKGDTPLLPRVDGTRWPQSMTCRPMNRAVRAAGLPRKVTIYTLRHSYISHALEAGANPELIAKQCGTSVLMISQTYAHVHEASRQATIERIGTSLRPAPAAPRAALRAVK